MHLLRPGTRLRQMSPRARSLSSVAWTPAKLTGLVFTLLPALSRQQGKLWQDAAKTLAATANGDPVRVAVCPYTAVELTAPSDAARPLLTDEGGGKWSLAFDGTDDYLTLASSGASDSFSASQTVGAGWQMASVLAGNRFILAKRNAANPYPCALLITTATRRFSTNAGADVNVDWPAAAVVNTWYRSMVGKSGTATTLYTNGSLVSSPTQAVGTANTAAWLVGCQNFGGGATHFWSGRMSAVVVAASALTTGTAAPLDSYLASVTP